MDSPSVSFLYKGKIQEDSLIEADSQNFHIFIGVYPLKKILALQGTFSNYPSYLPIYKCSELPPPRVFSCIIRVML